MARTRKKKLSLEQAIIGVELVCPHWNITRNSDGYRASIGFNMSSIPAYAIRSGLFDNPVDALLDAIIKHKLAIPACNKEVGSRE